MLRIVFILIKLMLVIPLFVWTNVRKIKFEIPIGRFIITEITLLSAHQITEISSAVVV